MDWCRQYDYPYSLYLARLSRVHTSRSERESIRQAIIESCAYPTPLVDILMWVLMPNHFHLVLKSSVDDGITTYLHRLCTSYAMYFNRTHEITGALFQGVFKSVLVEDEIQLQRLFKYIHLNPVAAGLVDRSEVNNYQWSSLPVYWEDKPSSEVELVNPVYI